MREVFSLSFYACACIGEMICSNVQAKHAFLAENVIIQEQGVSIAFSSFKHHKGSTPVTKIVQWASPDVCPAKLLRAYALKMEGPLFVWHNSTQVEAKEIMLCLQSCLLGAGEDTTGLSPHIFHIGAVSEVAGKRASESQLRMMARWKNNAYMKYVCHTHHMPAPQ